MHQFKSTLALLLAAVTLTSGVAVSKRQDRDLVECTFNISTQDTFETWEVNLQSQFNQGANHPLKPHQIDNNGLVF